MYTLYVFICKQYLLNTYKYTLINIYLSLKCVIRIYFADYYGSDNIFYKFYLYYT